MLGGYAGKVLFVDLSKGQAREESLEDKIYHDFLGCNGLGAKILFDRQKGEVDPLGSLNILGFVTGPLTGTALFGTRYMAVGKSALTGTWGEGNAAGYFPTHLKSAGYDAIFFIGMSENPVYLFIHNGRAEIRDAQHLWGRNTVETQDLLESELGSNVKVACIGPAGEKLSLISCIMNDRLERAVGRAGLGAVMGSKKLKAVAVIGTMKIPVADPEKVKELRRKQISILKDADVYKKYGAIGQTALFARVGVSSVKNWGGVGTRDFPNAAAISDESALKMEEKKEACWRCPIASGGVMKPGTQYKYRTGAHKPEYETAAAFGTNLLNDNLESIIMANDICNRYGMDVISVGMTLGCAMECYERGIVTKQDTDGIDLTWGNHQAIVAMTEKMCKREGFGAILADGSRVAAEKIGKGAEQYAMHVHGLEVPNADPRFAPSWAVTYVTSPMPARHMRGGAEWAELGRIPYGVELPKVEKLAFSGKGQIHAWLRKFYTLMDAAGLCMWGAKGLPIDSISDNLAAVTGWEYSREEMLEAGERIACICQSFNVREGLKPADFKLPPRIAGEPPLTEGPNANVTIPVESMTKEFFKAMDWDYATGKPSKKKLLELGLEEVAKELWP